MYFDDFEVMLTEGKVVQSNNYYPFGLQQNTSWTRAEQTPNAHKFNAATEYNDFTDTYDTPFRQYDPATGRFNGVDALAHMTPTLTPYRFGFNNPVSFNDPTGLNERPVELDDPNLRSGGGGSSIISGADNDFSMIWLSGGMGRVGVGHWVNQAARNAGAAGMERNARMMPGYAFNLAYGVTDETRFDVARRYSSDGADALSSVGLSIVTNQSYDPNMPGAMMPVHGLMYEGTFLGNLGPDYFSDNMGSILGTTGGSFGDALRGWADGIRDYVMGNTQGLRDKTQEWSDALDEHGKLVTALSRAAHERLAPAKGIMEVGFAGSGLASGVRLTVDKGSSIIFRAVSQAELDDIAKFGLRNTPGAYETGKLFAPTALEAAQFGRNNFMFDGLPNTIMKVRVPNSVLNSSYMFGADGMNAISIPANQLHKLQAVPLNYSPF